MVLNFGAVQDKGTRGKFVFTNPADAKNCPDGCAHQKSQTNAESVSKDLQDPKSVVADNYHTSPDKANKIFVKLVIMTVDFIEGGPRSWQGTDINNGRALHIGIGCGYYEGLIQQYKTYSSLKRNLMKI